ncbi:unnamed protein product [Blepharisma stoltei]|uniref:Uncharacterized protein n=1 Tax=Blepharisma stoltei TaxID=1481888 RepID=A0AAU9JRZ5_9CILI|nr:unnamed protein product [Blepharisma stoltei]
MNELLSQLHKERMDRTEKFRNIVIDNHIFEILEKPGAAVGSKLWIGGEELSIFLHRNPELIQGKSILELGAGVGLVSIVCSLFSDRVICSDKGEVLEIARENIRRNRNSAQVLEYGWSENSVGIFDVIVGSDIVYYDHDFVPLYQALMANSRVGTIFILSYRDRLYSMLDFFPLLKNDFVVREERKITNESYVYIYERVGRET